MESQKNKQSGKNRRSTRFLSASFPLFNFLSTPVKGEAEQSSVISYREASRNIVEAHINTRSRITKTDRLPRESTGKDQPKQASACKAISQSESESVTEQ